MPFFYHTFARFAANQAAAGAIHACCKTANAYLGVMLLQGVVWQALLLLRPLLSRMLQKGRHGLLLLLLVAAVVAAEVAAEVCCCQARTCHLSQNLQLLRAPLVMADLHQHTR
jgi:hypothetical protein